MTEATATSVREGGEASAFPSVLVLSNMYPAPDNAMFGAFIAKQEAALSDLGVRFRLVTNTRWRTGAVANGLKYAALLTRTVVAAVRGGFDGSNRDSNPGRLLFVAPAASHQADL